MQFSRRAFLEGAVAAALIAAANGDEARTLACDDHGRHIGGTGCSNVNVLAKPATFTYNRLEVAGWLSNYKLRCQDMARLIEAATFHHQGSLPAVEDARLWLERWNEFERVRDKWLAVRMAIGRSQGDGYEAGRDGRVAPDQPSGDLGLAWFNGYYLGIDDAKRRQGQVA